MAMPLKAKVEDMQAALVQVATFKAHPPLAPSQIIPVTFPSIFWMAPWISFFFPPRRYVIPQLAPVAAMVAPHSADSLPNLVFI